MDPSCCPPATGRALLDGPTWALSLSHNRPPYLAAGGGRGSRLLGLPGAVDQRAPAVRGRRQLRLSLQQGHAGVIRRLCELAPRQQSSTCTHMMRFSPRQCLCWLHRPSAASCLLPSTPASLSCRLLWRPRLASRSTASWSPWVSPRGGGHALARGLWPRGWAGPCGALGLMPFRGVPDICAARLMPQACAPSAPCRWHPRDLQTCG